MSGDPQPSMSTAASDPQARLRAAVAAFPAPGFAMIDGAHFDDVPKLFRRDRLFARSLYLDTADPEIQAAGPWLVGLDQAADATETVFALVGDKPAAVFWCCDGGERVLWRHLRTLNMAMIPQWAANGGSEPPADGSGQDPTAVTFRHYDPRVLGALMPCLDTAQFARVLGPAREIAFVTTDYGGMRRVVVDAAWPPASSGLLMLRSEQMSSLADRRLAASHRRIAAYLRVSAGPQTEDWDDTALHEAVRRYDNQAKQFGLKKERDVMLWGFIQTTSTHDLSRNTAVVRFMADADAGPTPESRFQQLFDLRLAILKGHG